MGTQAMVRVEGSLPTRDIAAFCRAFGFPSGALRRRQDISIREIGTAIAQSGGATLLTCSVCDAIFELVFEERSEAQAALASAFPDLPWQAACLQSTSMTWGYAAGRGRAINRRVHQAMDRPLHSEGEPLEIENRFLSDLVKLRWGLRGGFGRVWIKKAHVAEFEERWRKTGRLPASFGYADEEAVYCAIAERLLAELLSAEDSPNGVWEWYRPRKPVTPAKDRLPI